VLFHDAVPKNVFHDTLLGLVSIQRFVKMLHDPKNQANRTKCTRHLRERVHMHTYLLVHLFPKEPVISFIAMVVEVHLR